MTTLTFITEFTTAALERKLVTFDVFDTLLHRTCSAGTIALQTSRKIAAALHGLNVSDVETARERAVAVLRAEAVDAELGIEGQYLFDNLGQRLTSELSSIANDDAEDIRREVDLALSDEIRREYECVYLGAEIVAIAEKLDAAGKKIAAIVDTCHSRHVIVSMLAKVGLGSLFTKDNVYVSSDYNLTKSSGRLFGIVLEHHGVAPSEVVHIGDEHESDFVAAENCGIQSFHFDASVHHDRYLLDTNAQRTGIDVGLAVHEAACTALDQSLLSHRIAAAVAPVICQFSFDVAARATELDVDSVWFMARDGYLPMKLYELFDDGTFPLAQYLYVSRKSVAKASSTSYSLREAFMAQWNGESRKLRSLLAPWGWNDDTAMSMVAKFGFSSLDEEVDYATDPRFHRLTESAALQDIFRSDSLKKRGALRTHLDKAGFLSQRHVAVVDVGWAGQIQEALELAIEGEKRRPHVTGLYMALRGLGGYRRLAGYDLEGLIYDCSHHDWLAASIFNAVDVFEDTCRAHHGTVLGYDRNGDPILAADTASRVEELRDEPRLKSLQDAVMLYAARWISYVRMFGVPSDATKAAAVLTAARLTRFPTAEEASFFTSIGHSLDVGSDHLLARNVITGKRIIPWIGRLRAARWKEAAAADYRWGAALQFLLGVKRQMSKVKNVPLPNPPHGFVKDRHAQCGLPSSMPPEMRVQASDERGTQGDFPSLPTWGNILSTLGLVGRLKSKC